MKVKEPVKPPAVQGLGGKLTNPFMGVMGSGGKNGFVDAVCPTPVAASAISMRFNLIWQLLLVSQSPR
jgi:hypothetical protein